MTLELSTTFSAGIVYINKGFVAVYPIRTPGEESCRKTFNPTMQATTLAGCLEKIEGDNARWGEECNMWMLGFDGKARFLSD